MPLMCLIFLKTEAKCSAMKMHLKSLRRLCLASLLVCFALLWLGCANVLIHHRSNTSASIHVYLNWKRVCIVAQGETCRLRLRRGRYTFYAIVPGKPKLRWASMKRPALFVVDEETVLVLGAKGPVTPAPKIPLYGPTTPSRSQ